MRKTVLFLIYFGVLAGIGILLGCYIHASRVNQTTVMSGVAFVRELPYGEYIVGYTETAVFSYQERKNLEDYKTKYKDKIKIDPEVLKTQEKLFGTGSKKE